MLAESLEISNARDAAKIFNGGVARYCEFSSYLHEGAHVDAIFVGCKFSEVEWYWGLFNGTVLVDCKFISCTFRGTSFADARFVDCLFDRCRFMRDNLDAPCQNERSTVYGGENRGCSGGEFLSMSVRSNNRLERSNWRAAAPPCPPAAQANR